MSSARPIEDPIAEGGTLVRVPDAEPGLGGIPCGGPSLVLLAPPGLAAGLYDVQGARPVPGNLTCRALVVDTWSGPHAEKVAPSARPRKARPLEPFLHDGDHLHDDVHAQREILSLVEGAWSRLGPMTWAATTQNALGMQTLCAWCGTRLVAVVAPCQRPGDPGLV